MKNHYWPAICQIQVLHHRNLKRSLWIMWHTPWIFFNGIFQSANFALSRNTDIDYIIHILYFGTNFLNLLTFFDPLKISLRKMVTILMMSAKMATLGFLNLNLGGLLRGLFWGWKELKLLETWNSARKYTLISSFRNYTSLYQSPLSFADVIIFLPKLSVFLAKIVPLLKAIVWEQC